MSRRPKLVFISSHAVSHQVKFCDALQDYFEAEFWFYEMPERSRVAWWRVDLRDGCKVLKDVLFFKLKHILCSFRLELQNSEDMLLVDILL